MKKISTLVEGFTKANKELCKTRPAVEPGDVYLAYCALALCTIADKLDEGNNKRTCDGCRHNIFPDGDAECCTCSNYYADHYESGEE